jgi:hypothetical protein
MRAPSGKINLVTLLLLSVMAAGGYAVAMLGPLYADHWSVKEAVAMGVILAPRDNDGVVRAKMTEKLRSVGTHEELDENGRRRVVPGLGLKPGQIVIERDLAQKRVAITVTYEREVVLVPTQRVHRRTLIAHAEGPLQ